MNNQIDGKPIEILLVEDNPGDVRLTAEALKGCKMRNNLHVAQNGVEATEFLRREGKYAGMQRPDLILLDLNLPKKSGLDVLVEIKANEKTKCIPVIILTSSKSDEDILNSYNLYANCFITKPVDMEQFLKVVNVIEDFWLFIVKLPPR